LLLFLSLILSFGSVSCAVDEHVQAEEDFRQQASLVAGGSITVENSRGDLRFEGSDMTQVSVEAHKYFEGSEFDRERWMRETKIRVEGDEHHRYIKVEYPADFHWEFWGGNHGVNLIVRVPHQVNANLKEARGHVTVSDIAGKLEVASDRGDVDIASLDGELRARGDRGNLHVRDSFIRDGVRVTLDRGSVDMYLKQFAGDSDLEVSRGSLTMTIPKNSAFTLDAERSRRSSFHTDFGLLARGGFNSDRVQADVNGGGPTLRLRADRGSVWLRAGLQ
jgi:hypothetical protein